ncbi:hypothetical protein RvY_19015 [Ramazzottius varieornatus]|uniref:G-protein coupled receptors family 1 profile domain-containing protein n=1 Tax=Ramazzottius varieornatus TaxID=947166 RepID=A0A1D1W821_RAMVA|nr:hypothetical protein RvY_19015 [Ramazzottius varieornatus]
MTNISSFLLHGVSNSTTALHFLQKYEQGLKIWLAVMLVCGLTGGAINYFLAGTILSVRTLRSGSGYLIAHALIAAGTMLFLSYPAFAIQTYMARHEAPTFRLCQALAWQYFVVIQATHWSETLVAFNRFVAVILPHHYKKITTSRVILTFIAFCWALALLVQSMPVFGVGGSIDSSNAWKSCLVKPSERPEGFLVSVTFGAILPIALEGLLYGFMFCIFFVRRFLRMGEIQAAGVDQNLQSVRMAEVARINKRFNVAKTLALGFVATSSCSLSTPLIAAVFPGYSRYPLVLLFLRVILVVGYAVHPDVTLILTRNLATPDPKIPCPECGELYTPRGMSRHTGKTACVTNLERNRNNSAPSSQSVVAPADQLIATKPIHEVLQHLKASTKVFRRIPKGARLKLPDRDTSKKGNLTTAVKNNLSRQLVNLELNEKQTVKKQPKDSVLKKLVEGKINDGEISGALRVLSSEDSVAAPTPEVLDTLRDKHPSESPDSLFPNPPDQLSLPEEVTVEEILAAVKSFPNGSAGGVDGLRPQHLKDMLSAVKKKDGGLRLIAVGNTLRRLAGKIVVKRVGRVLEEQVRPEQVGCGTRGEAEAAVHAVRCFLEEGRDKSQVLLKLDFKNAFNTIHRDVLLRVVRDSLPKYFPFAQQFYRYPSKLLFGQQSLESARGVQQGDPLGPLLFCVLIQKLTKSLTSPLNVWYLDDGTIGGKIETVLSDLQVVISEGWKLGLELNSVKRKLFSFGGSALERQAVQERAAVACPGILFSFQERPQHSRSTTDGRGPGGSRLS